MSEMIERMVTAACAAVDGTPCVCAQENRDCGDGRENFRRVVRAVLVAGREPTLEMVEAGDGAMDWDSSDINGSWFVRYNDGDAAKSWQAMIDAALAEDT